MIKYKHKIVIWHQKNHPVIVYRNRWNQNFE